MAFAKDLADGTTTVFSNGGAMCGVLGSRFAVSIGDEPGTGGGVTSQVFMDEATFLAWSPDVLLQGRPAGDAPHRQDAAQQGHTISAGG